MFWFLLADNKLFDAANALRSENLQLSVQIEKLRLENGHSGGVVSSAEAKLQEKIQHLEQKLLVQQEELTELHRRKGENAQQIIDLNTKLHEKEKQLALKEVRLVGGVYLLFVQSDRYNCGRKIVINKRLLM